LAHKTPGPATSSMAQRAQLSGGLKLIRLPRSRMGPARRQCVSFFLPPGHATYQRVNTTVNDKPVTATPPTRGLPSLARDHCTPPSRRPLAEPNSIHSAPKFTSASPNPKPTCPFLAHTMATTLIRSEHFLRFDHVEPHAGCSHDSGQLSRRHRLGCRRPLRRDPIRHP